MKTLLIATHNKAKLTELKFGVRELVKKGVTVVSLRDIRIKDDPVETGSTFDENSKLKAFYYATKTHIATLGDDGGLLIPYLNNEPGVKSKRWLGYEATDNQLIDYALKRLNGVALSDRTAYLQTSLCFYNPNTKNYYLAQERIKGIIADKPSGRPTQGYPYRALFIVERYMKYYDELSEDEHGRINHRLQALKQLIPKIERDLLQ